MKLAEPKVYVIGKQFVVQEELDRFLKDEDVVWSSDSDIGSEVITETAGRICYMSYSKPRPGGNKAYLSHIKETSHGSVCEHAVWSFVITGISRSLSHELVRHRAGVSPSQLSQRYVDESETRFVIPPDLREEVEAALRLFYAKWPQPNFNMFEGNTLLDRSDVTEGERAGIQWLIAVRLAKSSYGVISDYLADKASRCGIQKTEARKFARQAARSVLPNATETKMTITVNARALRNIIEQRGSTFADPEIRRLANLLLEAVRNHTNNLFDDYTQHELPSGISEIRTKHPKI